MKFKDWLQVAATSLSMVIGFISIGLVVFKGGALVHEVQNHENRILTIEARGSPPIAEHIKLDDERNSNVKERLSRVESAVIVISTLQVEIGRIEEKLDAMKIMITGTQQHPKL
jgi:hypothetical protein